MGKVQSEKGVSDESICADVKFTLDYDPISQTPYDALRCTEGLARL